MKIDIIVPAAGESVTEADIARWFKENGEFVNANETILELETDKASMEMVADKAGVLNILVEEGETVQVGDTIGFIEEGAASSAPAPVAAAPAAPAEEVPATPAPANEATTTVDVKSQANTVFDKKMPSPAARRIIVEHGLSAQDIHGSGKDGRITKADVLRHIESLEKETSLTGTLNNQTAPVLGQAPVADEPAEEEGRVVRSERMSRLRRTVASRLVEAQQTAAILTTFNEVDMQPIMDIRKKYKDEFKDTHEIGLGFMSFFAKATAKALMEFPIMNAQVDGTNILYHDFVDMGIAVSTPRGLVVPVIKNIEDMSFNAIEAKIRELALKGRDSNLTPDEMTGGTFTMTNGGTFGSMLSTPILNRPQSAILGMHNIVQRPVAIDGKVEIRPIMYLAVSYDHRIIDGSDAVRFLVKIKTLLEEPTRLLLDL
mgnify:CR=1 FL=1